MSDDRWPHRLPGLLLGLSVSAPAWAGFGAGSYGRVQVESTPEGGHGTPADIVAHPGRLQAAPYLELDLWWDMKDEAGGDWRVVVTPAISGQPFHYDGEWDADLALRNLYVEADDWSPAPLRAWAGSRMVRGDDVHLLDFWPLDNLNTVGGGLVWEPQGWRLAGSVGLARPSAEAYQVQSVPVPLAGSVGAEDVLTLDRQRAVGSVKAGRFFATDAATFRVNGYGELHHLPEGQRVVEEQLREALPADGGGVAGLQLSGWGWARESYLHVWGRLATGLATTDPLSVPGTFATDHRTTGAREWLVALAGNQDWGPVALQLGAYARHSRDADGQSGDPDDGWESAVALRPLLALGEHGSLGLELSRQARAPEGLSPRTDTLLRPRVTKVAIIPAIQPHSGSYARPQLRAQYVYEHLNDDARRWFPDEDPRHQTNHQHFIGIGAEWWIDSNDYLPGDNR